KTTPLIPLLTILLTACSQAASTQPASQPNALLDPKPTHEPSPITLTSPADYQIFQRQSATAGKIKIAGSTSTNAKSLTVTLNATTTTDSPIIPAATIPIHDHAFSDEITAP